MKSLVYSERDWNKLWASILKEYPPSINISWVCKRELGFTVRKHTYWDREGRAYIHEVHLDFYDEAMKTLFILKYK